MTLVRLPAKQHKYGAKRTQVEGITFPSQREAKRYWELRLLEKAGKISNLRLQSPIVITINGVHVCEYRADFVYTDDGLVIYEDAKGMRTAEYKLKKKLVWACHGIQIQEV